MIKKATEDLDAFAKTDTHEAALREMVDAFSDDISLSVYVGDGSEPPEVMLGSRLVCAIERAHAILRRNAPVKATGELLVVEDEDG